MTEQEFSESILLRLASHFDIQREWWGTCFGKRVRIDALLKPKDISGWKNKDIIVGVEFKRDMEIKEGHGLNPKSLAQCIDYSYTEWDHIGRIPILICPGIGHFEKWEYYSITRLLCQFNVGELKQTESGLTFLFAGSSITWSESKGIKDGKFWTFKPRIGSR